MWNASKQDFRSGGDVVGCCSVGGVDTSRASNMDQGYGGGQSPGERSIRSGIISKTSPAVCA